MLVIKDVLRLRMTYLGNFLLLHYNNDEMALTVPNCFKLNSGIFDISSNLMTGKGSLLQLFEANYVFGN